MPRRRVVARREVLRHLVDIQYSRNDYDLKPGTFRVRGDTLEVMPAYGDQLYRIEFFGDEIDRITQLDALTGEILSRHESLDIFPAKHFITPQEKLEEAIIDIEAELEDEPSGFIVGEPGGWDLLPLPEGSFNVGIDGGYVRNWFDKKHHFEVIVGKSILRFEAGEENRSPSLKRFGFVQTLDTKSKRRLYEVLHAQDLQMNQNITFLSDGDDTLRRLQLEMSPKPSIYWIGIT